MDAFRLRFRVKLNAHLIVSSVSFLILVLAVV